MTTTTAKQALKKVQTTTEENKGFQILDTLEDQELRGNIGRVKRLDQNKTHVSMAVNNEDGSVTWYALFFRNTSYEKNGKTITYNGADWAETKLAKGDSIEIRGQVQVIQSGDNAPYNSMSISRFGFVSLIG